MDLKTDLAEFRSGWRVVLGAALGVGMGIAGLLNYNAGLFVEGMARDFGLTRTQYGAAFFAATLAMALAMPLVGRMVDRWGPRNAAAFGAVALALGFAMFSQVGAIGAYFAVMIAIGLFGSASAPVAFTRAVVEQFDRSRGLALGFTQLGIGLAAAIFPPLVSAQIAAHGWQWGAMVLATIALAGLVPIVLCIPARLPQSTLPEGEAEATFRAVRRSGPFLIQLAAFSSMALAFAGMLPHFVPMLQDAGMSLPDAGALAGLIGLSVIITRVIVGWLADRIEPALLGAACCALCAAGCLALGLGGTAMAPVGAIALGAAMGAEADLIGIMTARNFPLATYSRGYALQYAAFMVAAGLGPLWVGFLADATGSYDAPVLLVALAMVVPIALFLRIRQVAASGRAA